jgi:hypothetical protein
MLNPNSTYLSERLISRLSPLRRANLERRLRERAQDAGLAVQTGTVNDVPHAQLQYAMLGRLSALTA